MVSTNQITLDRSGVSQTSQSLINNEEQVNITETWNTITLCLKNGGTHTCSKLYVDMVVSLYVGEVKQQHKNSDNNVISILSLKLKHLRHTVLQL